MTNLTEMTETATRTANGGTKRYYCPWNDYSSTSYWKTYGHAIVCAYKHGFFSVPIALIKAGLRLR